jgi:NADH-ubiquinone oxidoreductase chain 6
MSTFYILNETYTNGYISNILNIVSILAIVSGILVLISKNPIVSVLFLISLFGAISIYLNLIGLSFIALSYLIVYIGAVSILFLFILMLINIRLSELQDNTVNSIPLAIIIIISLIYTIYHILPYNITTIYSYDSFLKGNFLYKNKLISIYDNDLFFTISSN